MPKRKITITYLFFYLIFSADTWRILMGLIVALILAPALIRIQPMSVAGQVVLSLMLLAIGYALCAAPGRKIAQLLKRFFLGPDAK